MLEAGVECHSTPIDTQSDAQGAVVGCHITPTDTQLDAKGADVGCKSTQIDIGTLTSRNWDDEHNSWEGIQFEACSRKSLEDNLTMGKMQRIGKSKYT